MVDDATQSIPDEIVAPLPREETERPVCCRSCGHALTLARLAIEVDGRHEHTFRNPAGYSFHVVCFSEAAGCHREGPMTSEATWFIGHAWCFALCARCQTHVGWSYRAARGDGHFFGLIATRLAR